MIDAQTKKRLCCPPLQAEVGIYDGLAEVLPDDLLADYNEMIDRHLVSMARAREEILSRMPAAKGRKP